MSHLPEQQNPADYRDDPQSGQGFPPNARKQEDVHYELLSFHAGSDTALDGLQVWDPQQSSG